MDSTDFKTSNSRKLDCAHEIHLHSSPSKNSSNLLPYDSGFNQNNFFLEDFNKSPRSHKEYTIKKAKSENNYLPNYSNTCQMKLSSSIIDQMHEIQTIADSANLKIFFKGDFLIVKGDHCLIQTFSKKLEQLEKNSVKKFYPKYWDSCINTSQSLNSVPINSEEFQAVSEIFLDTLPRARITKLKRSMNFPLMEKYVENQQNWVESNPRKKLHKKLLFHGTRAFDPEQLAMGEVGFDLAFSKGGLYGRGLYFASNSIYSHDYAHKIDKNTFSMIVAEVVIGDSQVCKSDTKLTGPEKGFDSVLANQGWYDEFYVVYENYFSFPLYILEYNLDGRDIPKEVLKLRFRTSELKSLLDKMQGD